jgi:peptide/nickel transport system substrate-binding protein
VGSVDAFFERGGRLDFDAMIGGWAAFPGLVGIRQTWMSSGESNELRYRNRTFDALVDSALSSFDREASRRLWGRAFQQVVNDAPAIWLYEQRAPVALHKRFVVPPLRADGWWHGLADWSVDPAQRIDRDRIGLAAPGDAR